jgi:hypothetical protein
VWNSQRQENAIHPCGVRAGCGPNHRPLASGGLWESAA